jgi:leader peptidase (prepilin peptidase)/N-methyltransferase
MDIGYVLGSLIMMTVLGLSVGNFATSLTYRLPRGLKIANDPPYCDTCHTYLETRDMFPFVSWLINRAKCRFCGAPVPALYAFVELGCAVWFNATWFTLWPHAVDAYLVTLAHGVFVITLLSLHIAEKRLFPIVLILIAGLGAIYRVLFDASVLGFLISAYLALMVGVAGWLLSSAVKRQRQPFPAVAILLAVAGLCVGKDSLPMLVGGSAVLALPIWLISQFQPSLRGSTGVIAVGLTLMTLMLFPSLGRTLSSECAQVECVSGKGCQRLMIANCHGPR